MPPFITNYKIFSCLKSDFAFMRKRRTYQRRRKYECIMFFGEELIRLGTNTNASRTIHLLSAAMSCGFKRYVSSTYCIERKCRGVQAQKNGPLRECIEKEPALIEVCGKIEHLVSEFNILASVHVTGSAYVESLFKQVSTSNGWTVADPSGR
jgi:hypothetical protein